MLLRVLGCSGAEYPGHNLPSFLIDDRLLLDAGTIGSSLNEDEQWRIKNILITHSHLDHIKGIPFLADNLIIKNRRHGISVFGTRSTLNTLKRNLLNNKLWPDFTKISASMEPVIRFRPVLPGNTFRVDGYTVTAHRVAHTVPAVGYSITGKNGRTVVYAGDTGPTERIWRFSRPVSVVIVEASFPSTMESLALKTGHLTLRLVLKEIEKMEHLPEKIYITHPKPQYVEQIRNEIKLLGNRRISLLKQGRTYKI